MPRVEIGDQKDLKQSIDSGGGADLRWEADLRQEAEGGKLGLCER